jgi:hypothetical protein
LLHTLDLLAPLCPFALPHGDTLAERFAAVERLGDLITIISPLRDDNLAAELILGVAVMVLDRYRRPLQEYLAQTFADGRPLSALLLLVAFTPHDPAIQEDVWAERLRLSNAEQRALMALGRARGFRLLEQAPLDNRQIHRYYRQTGETGIGGVLLALAEYLVSQRPIVNPAEWGRLLEDTAAPCLDAFFHRHQQVVAPPPLLSGDDLTRDLGLRAGPGLGHLLDRLLEEQAAGTVRTKKEALRLAKRLSSPHNP